MGNELYYIDKDGRRSDAGLHDDLLNGAPVAEHQGRLRSARACMADYGTSAATARLAYGLTEAELPDPPLPPAAP